MTTKDKIAIIAAILFVTVLLWIAFTFPGRP